MNRLLVALMLLLPLAASADVIAEEAKADPKVEAKAEAKEDLQAAKRAPPKQDSEGFVPVRQDEQLATSESLPANKLVGAAYGFILAAMVVWIASVAMRSRKVEEELADLRKKIEPKA
jgi:hypothetical protein